MQESGEQRRYYNLDSFITVHAVEPNSHYFWSQQFFFDCSGTRDPGGYMGLQHCGGNTDRIAIFSIWNALAAEPGEGAEAKQFAGEGEGFQCLLPLAWKDGVEYRVRLWRMNEISSIDEIAWWGAWVMNTRTHKEQFIGRIQTPANWWRLKNWTNAFVEHYLEVPCCADTPYSHATFGIPAMNNGATHPHGPAEAMSYGNCSHQAAVQVLDTHAVVVETGISRRPR